MEIAPQVIDEVIGSLRFDEHGLIPAIAQAESGSVLMLAWMNREALRETLASGRVCYYSRSRKSLWKKGETSGHTQKLISLRYDCDADAILMTVDQEGPACHTNRPNCFYHHVGPEGVRVISDPVH